ncbi:MAG: helix-turn-helix domain-containing protein [Terriglobales bacterium]
MAISTELILNASQKDELVAISQSRSLPAGYVFRAKLILMLAEGASFRAIKHKLGTTAPTIVRWKERFLSGGIDGLHTYHPGQPPSVLTPALRARRGSGRHPEKASRWIDALELPQTRGPSGR